MHTSCAINYTVKLCSSSIFDWSFRNQLSLYRSSSALGGLLSQVLYFRSRSLRPTPSGVRSHALERVPGSDRGRLLLLIVVRIFVEGKEGLQIVLRLCNIGLKHQFIMAITCMMDEDGV